MKAKAAANRLATLDEAIGKAVDFLAERQLPDGSIDVLINNDPQMRGECQPDPSIFPTALAAHALSFAPEADAVRMKGLQFLLAEMEPDGLWKHWPKTHPHQHELPPDMDDTVCSSAALRAAGLAFPDNKPLILANRARGGLFYTWFTPRAEWTGNACHRRIAWSQLRHPLVLYMFFTRTSARPYDIDGVVNANTLHYLGAGPQTQPIMDHLLGILRAGWETEADKWYESAFVVRYFLARALGGVSPEAADLIAARVEADAPTTALEAALSACSLMYCGRSPGQPAIDAILAMQEPSGGWPRAAVYFGGRRRRKDGGFDAPHPDTPRWGSEELTTAYCVEALARWRALHPA